MTILGLFLTVAALVLAIWAVKLAKRADTQLSSIEGLSKGATDTLNKTESTLGTLREDLEDFDRRQGLKLDQLAETAERIQELSSRAEAALDESGNTLDTLRKDLSEFDNRQGAKLDELAETTEGIQELVDSVVQGSSGEEPTEEEDPTSEHVAEYARMRLLGVEALPEDVRRAVEGQASQPIVWALQRRGPGRARWLVGTENGGPWRVTRRRDDLSVTEVPALAPAVEPHRLSDLDDEATTALVEATGLEPRELDQTAYRRQTRGVPVYYTMQNTGRGPQAWRLVKTRWGWSAVPDDE